MIFPDGRSLVASVGEKRFKVLSTTQQDGYAVAHVEYVEDVDPPVTPSPSTPAEEQAERQQLLQQKKQEIEEKYNNAKELVKQRFQNGKYYE